MGGNDFFGLRIAAILNGSRDSFGELRVWDLGGHRRDVFMAFRQRRKMNASSEIRNGALIVGYRAARVSCVILAVSLFPFDFLLLLA